MEDLAPDVLKTLAVAMSEDVLSGNFDLAKSQKIKFVSSMTFGGASLVGLMFRLVVKVFALVIVVACGFAAFAYANRDRFVNRFDEWARNRCLMELRKRTTATCALDACRVRMNEVTLRRLTIGNSDAAEFTSPHLAKFDEIKIAIDFFSALGRMQVGNFVFGFVTTKVDEIFVSGGSIMLEERGRAKNYKIMRAREDEKVVVVKGEEKSEAEAAAPAADGFFAGISNSLEATQKAIDAQLKEAMKLPGAALGTLQNAGSDVTKRLYALAEILDKLKRASPIDDEEEKHLNSFSLRRAPTVLKVNNLTFYDWSLTIHSVASTPFQFTQFEMNDFIGRPGQLGKDVGIGLVTEILNDFHRKIFSGVTDGVGNVTSTILGAGTTIVGGVASGVTNVGSTLVGGVSDGIASIGQVRNLLT